MTVSHDERSALVERAEPAYRKGLKLVCCCGGIMLLLGVYGVQQERIMVGQYGGEYFTASVFLVLLNRLASVTYALGRICYSREAFRSACPEWKFGLVSISNVVATTCQYEALKYVSFPVQMLGKSSKMVPVMMWGIAMGKKRYSLRDWLIAAVVTLGCTLFLAGGTITSAKARAAGEADALGWAAFLGLLLMLGYLGSDGFTSTFQEKLFADHAVSTDQQMFWVNLFAVGLSMALLGTSGLQEGVAFAQRHPVFLLDAVALSLSATIGQVFIYETILNFGALVFAATMNARQLMSIMVSIHMQQHSVTALQIVGVALTFGGLFFKVYLGYVEATLLKSESSPRQITTRLTEKSAVDEASEKETSSNPEIETSSRGSSEEVV